MMARRRKSLELTDTPYRTSPSTISRYFFHDCERFLRYTSASAKQRKLEKIPTRNFDHSPLMKSILESGYIWEEKVLKSYLKRKVKIAPGTGKAHTRRFDWDTTAELLRTAEPNTYLYQPTIRIPKSFYDQYGIDPSIVTVSDNHPDLIAILPNGSRGRMLRIIDVKRGEALKLSYRVQILLYAIQLNDIIEDLDITDTTVDLHHGGIWLGGQETPNAFELASISPHLETFLRDDLMRILRANPEDVNWHVYFRCEWCEYFEYCRERMRSLDDISRLAHLSAYGKRHLESQAGVKTITQLGKFLRRKNADEVLGQCASLAGQRPFLTNQVTALRSGTGNLHGASSPMLPRGENIALILTLQDEPLGQSLYLAGIHMRANLKTCSQVFTKSMLSKLQSPKGKLQPIIFLARKQAQADKVQADWIRFLYTILHQVDAYNKAQKKWEDQISLQAYVLSEREKVLLVSCLMDALRKPNLAKEAIALLFHFQASVLIIAEEHPEKEVPYPVVVLLNALGKLMALPIDVSYTLPEALQALGSSFKYRREDYYHFPLGHGLRAEAIHAVWHCGKTDVIPRIEKQAIFHLYAIASLLQSIRDKANKYLFAWPPKFLLPGVGDFDDIILSRLAFFTRYESLIRCLDLRDGRCEPHDIQVLTGQVLELVARNTNVMKVVSDGNMELEANGFPDYLLVEDNEAGRRAQLEYKDYYCRNRPWKSKEHPARAVIEINKIDEDDLGFPKQITVSYRKPFSRDHNFKGKRFLLYPRYTDYTSDRIIDFLKMYVPIDGLFLNTLRNPTAAAVKTLLPRNVERAAKKGEEQLGLTASQLEAYRRIRGQKLVPVWGPPGTGKTHFLASIILGLAQAHTSTGKSFRVLVTAFTHAAIENLLRKIAEIQLNTNLARNMVVGKAKDWKSSHLAKVHVIDEFMIPEWVEDNEHSVLGSTVYSCAKKFEDVDYFDLVIIDEASQLRVPEASIPFGLVGNKGRLVLAGDHLQLPPIVAGVYPETPPGETILHRSIFESICPLTGGHTGFLSQLNENFRMNDVLTSFAASLLYGQEFKCFNDEISRRRLNMKSPFGDRDLIKACLDPQYPIVIVVLEGVRAAKENIVEAELVASMVCNLRKLLRTSKGRLYQKDSDFFRDAVFIVSPHRAQIRTIQRALYQMREWNHKPFVDTVDKMQGQEADAVIVSYGVSDPEFAMKEADFIYGLNRLNVAITRAKTKCVVCLPRPLIEATPSILDQSEAARGLAFMRQLVSRVAASGEKNEYDLGNNMTAVVYRSGACIT